MYLDLAVFTAHIACCFCFVSYEIFPGFETKLKLQNSTLKHVTTPKHDYDPPHIIKPNINKNIPVSMFPKNKLTSDVDVFLSIEEVTSKLHESKETNVSELLKAHITNQSSNGTIDDWHTTVVPLTLAKFHCFENEKPVNIGTYEVPSERDLVLLIQNNLVRLFNTYQQKALYFLKDLKEATKATTDIENKCRTRGRDYTGYKQCVRKVSSRCEVIAKNLITSLQKQRADVSSFLEGTVCNVTGIKADPIVMIKTLAMEDASLEFALPSFLRLLGACSYHCQKKLHNTILRTKPPRHLTDQEVVIRHLLAKKHPNYRMHKEKDSKWRQRN